MITELRRAWHELRGHRVLVTEADDDPTRDVIVCIGCRKEWPA